MKKVIEKCKKAEVYMYLIPSMVIFSIFLFYPFFKTIYLSLYKTNKLGKKRNCMWDWITIKAYY